MSTEVALQSTSQLKLIRSTVAADLHENEFNLFIHMCRQWRLDPMRRQIYAIVYNKDKPEKRKVSYVTGIDGYRTIADRTGNYRPGERSVVVEESARDPKSNPQGIVSATAGVWKRTNDGQWHEFSETVYWDEFAPLREVWEFNQGAGKKVPSGKFELDTKGQWGRMGRVMLQKCAEAAALRRGWPDELSDLYIQEEMDQARVIDITPSEELAKADEADRQTQLGGPTVLIDWMDSKPLDAVPANDTHGRIRDFIKKNAEEPMTILAFEDRNRAALRQFWGMKPEEALALKKAFETYRNVAQAQAAE